MLNLNGGVIGLRPSRQLALMLRNFASATAIPCQLGDQTILEHFFSPLLNASSTARRRRKLGPFEIVRLHSGYNAQPPHGGLAAQARACRLNLSSLFVVHFAGGLLGRAAHAELALVDAVERRPFMSYMRRYCEWLQRMHRRDASARRVWHKREESGIFCESYTTHTTGNTSDMH